MRRALDLLGSLRLTLGLLIGMVALFGAGLVIPQRAVLQGEAYDAWRQGNPRLVDLLEALQLTDVYRSPLAIALWSLFFVNLVVVMARRIPVTAERVRVDRPIPDPATAQGFSVRRSLAAGRGALEEAGTFFAGRGFHLASRDGALRAVRNRFAPVATLAFHLSFLLVAFGATLSFYTRFEGVVELGPGERFSGALEQYARPPLLPRVGEPPRVRFTLEEVEPRQEGRVATGLRLKIRDDQFGSHVFGINDPYEVGHASVVFKRLGVAPLLIVQDAAGAEVFGGWMRLDTTAGKPEPFRLLDWAWTARFFPDYVRDREGERTRSLEPLDPALSLTVESQFGQRIAPTLRPGESARFGPYTITFADWRYWVTLYVRAERGLGIIWSGFGLGALSLVTRFFLYRREYIVRPGGAEGAGTLEIAGRAEYFRALFEDEAALLLAELERALRDGAGDGA